MIDIFLSILLLANGAAGEPKETKAGGESNSTPAVSEKEGDIPGVETPGGGGYGIGLNAK